MVSIASLPSKKEIIKTKDSPFPFDHNLLVSSFKNLSIDARFRLAQRFCMHTFSLFASGRVLALFLL